jgi:hypothetical protein
MSFGAISRPAVLALSNGARKVGIWMNTGEGGLSSYHLEGGCDIVYQIGTAKYGVRSKDGKLCGEKLWAIAKYPQVKMFEIKMSQRAKPGKGGILPAAKVTEEIAKIRGIDAGQDSISLNGHEDIESVDDLLDMISHIRHITGKPVGFKIVVGQVEFFHDRQSESLWSQIKMEAVAGSRLGQKLVVRFNSEARSGGVFLEDGKEIPSTIAYWFAWISFYPASDVYRAP